MTAAAPPAPPGACAPPAAPAARSLTPVSKVLKLCLHALFLGLLA
ncbi:pyridoxamine 5'-phosphate oxidase family protein, partial [Streptomyces sp. WAC05950]